MSGKLISDLSKLTDEQLEQTIMIPGSKEGEPKVLPSMFGNSCPCLT